MKGIHREQNWRTAVPDGETSQSILDLANLCCRPRTGDAALKFKYGVTTSTAGQALVAVDALYHEAEMERMQKTRNVGSLSELAAMAYGSLARLHESDIYKPKNPDDPPALVVNRPIRSVAESLMDSVYRDFRDELMEAVKVKSNGRAPGH